MLLSRKTKVEPRVETALLPNQVARAYNFPANVDLSKTTVAILELGGSYQLQDVVNYCNQYKYPIPKLTNVYVEGATQQSSDADGEVALDICVVAGTALGANIIVVFCPNTQMGFEAGLQQCIDLNPTSISISWGSSIDGYSQIDLNQFDAILQKAAAKNIPVFVASGDNGSSDGTYGTTTDYPASSPWAFGCGGTSLQLDANGARLSEVVWSLAADGSGTGGGIATIYATPAFQSKLTQAAGRKVPDLSGNADPYTGYIVEVNGKKMQFGGTSAVAPLMAALACIFYAVTGKPLTIDFLYQNENCFYDVVSGNNGAYSAGVGFDCCTGLGVLDGTAITQVANGQVPTPIPQPPAPPPAAPVKKSLWQKILEFLHL